MHALLCIIIIGYVQCTVHIRFDSHVTVFTHLSLANRPVCVCVCVCVCVHVWVYGVCVWWEVCVCV